MGRVRNPEMVKNREKESGGCEGNLLHHSSQHFPLSWSELLKATAKSLVFPSSINWLNVFIIYINFFLNIRLILIGKCIMSITTSDFLFGTTMVSLVMQVNYINPPQKKFILHY